MSKQEKALTLNRTAHTAIVSSFVHALSANDATGSLLTQVCETASKFLKGAEIPKDDRDSIVADIAQARGWKKESYAARASEVNVILRAYVELPDALSAFKQRANRCQWHDGMKLARRLNAGDSVSKAVAFALKKGTGNTTPPSGRVASALKSWYADEPRKREAILKAAHVLGIKLTVQQDA
jgi:hypothetical protein